jgi:hypothetical protein
MVFVSRGVQDSVQDFNLSAGTSESHGPSSITLKHPQPANRTQPMLHYAIASSLRVHGDCSRDGSERSLDRLSACVLSHPRKSARAINRGKHATQRTCGWRGRRGRGPWHLPAPGPPVALPSDVIPHRHPSRDRARGRERLGNSQGKTIEKANESELTKYHWIIPRKWGD